MTTAIEKRLAQEIENRRARIREAKESLSTTGDNNLYAVKCLAQDIVSAFEEIRQFERQRDLIEASIAQLRANETRGA